ncbi:MAG TPA: hypothetical protein VK926_09405 [Gaiellaceae bacterium]|nr:hypothetical protein [Gaiellaceae bacterium]
MATGGTPIWVWVVYALGLLAATIFVASALFVAGAYIASDEVPVTLDTSMIGIVVWGGLIALAVVTWLVRRRGGAR